MLTGSDCEVGTQGLRFFELRSIKHVGYAMTTTRDPEPTAMVAMYVCHAEVGNEARHKT